MTHCIDLEADWGGKYRVRLDKASYMAEPEQFRTAERPWHCSIPGRYGHVCPWGGDLLAASVDGHPNIAGTIRRLPYCQVVQDGDGGELTATFHVDHLPAVAKLLKLRRRKRLTDQQKAAIAERGRLALEAYRAT